MRSVASRETWESSSAGLSGYANLDEEIGDFTVFSMKEFHSWQLGQRPSHLRLSLPHCWQTKMVLTLDLSPLVIA
jgi:hypothetical protein